MVRDTTLHKIQIPAQHFTQKSKRKGQESLLASVLIHQCVDSDPWPSLLNRQTYVLELGEILVEQLCQMLRL